MKVFKEPEATSFLFLLHQKLKKIPIDISADEHVVAITNSIGDCLNWFAPEKKLTLQNNWNQWIANKIKNAMKRRNRLFQIWINNPTSSNHKHYTKYRNRVSAIIHEAKKIENFNKLGQNPSARLMYETLKTNKSQQRQPSKPPQLENLNTCFVNVVKSLSSKKIFWSSSFFYWRNHVVL